MTYRDRIEQALGSAAPIDALREYARELSRKGMRRSEIFRAFFDVYKELQASGREEDEAILGDVLDMLTGYYVGQNLDLPD